MARGIINPAELYQDAQRRSREWEPSLGAVDREVTFENPTSGVLNGMVVAIKNQFDVAGSVNWISREGGETQPVDRDATVVSRLRQAGATVFCTTESPHLDAPGGVTPQTANPRTPNRVSGGSSGGSAAAVAAGIVHGALGSDSGGSIRIPAACCGVVGLQTTRGLVPLTGSGGLTYSIGNVGPIASTVGDTRRLLEAIQGVDVEDPYGVAPTSLPRWDGRPLRLALPAELVDRPLDPEVSEMFTSVIKLLSENGHRVERTSLPLLSESMRIGPPIVGLVESAAILQSHFAIRGEMPPAAEDLIRRSEAVTGMDYARANDVVARLRLQVETTLQTFDMLILPTLPCRVPSSKDQNQEVDVEVGGILEPRTSALTRLVNPWNLAAVPAGSLPISVDSDGGAMSLQVVGAPFADGFVLDVMEYLERAFGGPWDTATSPG